MRITVCPNCKSVNCIQTIESVIEYYHYNAEKMDYERVKVGDGEVLSIYCSECGEFFDSCLDSLDPEDYVLEFNEQKVTYKGSMLSSLSDEEVDEIMGKFKEKA